MLGYRVDRRRSVTNTQRSGNTRLHIIDRFTLHRRPDLPPLAETLPRESDRWHILLLNIPAFVLHLPLDLQIAQFPDRPVQRALQAVLVQLDPK